MHEGFPGKVENCGQGSSSTFTLITRTASGRPKLKQRHYHWNWNAVGLSYRKNRSYHMRDFCVCGLGSDLVSPTEGTQTNGHSSCCLYQLAATRQRPRHSLAHSFIHSLTGPLRHVSVQVGLARLSLRSSWWVSTHTHPPTHLHYSHWLSSLTSFGALIAWMCPFAFTGESNRLRTKVLSLCLKNILFKQQFVFYIFPTMLWSRIGIFFF